MRGAGEWSGAAPGILSHVRLSVIDTPYRRDLAVRVYLNCEITPEGPLARLEGVGEEVAREALSCGSLGDGPDE